MRFLLKNLHFLLKNIDFPLRNVDFITKIAFLRDNQTQVSFQWKNPDFLSRNPDFLLRNGEFMIKTGRGIHAAAAHRRGAISIEES